MTCKPAPRLHVRAAVAILLCAVTGIAASAPAVRANQYLWAQFSAAERLSLMKKYPDLELVPTDAVGTIQSAQAADRSTAATHGGAALGSAVGQAAYIDHAFKGRGSSYSALTQVGAALVGAAVGSALDSPGQRKFLLSYGVRTADGEVREVRVESAEEITRPVGQCVFLADLAPASPSLCVTDKTQFLQQLIALEGAAQTPDVGAADNKPVSCRLPNVGLMTLEPATCRQLQGTIEK